jgi:outer membrane protein assembly factor BamB
MKQAKVLYILSNGRVAAINKKDGSIVWEIKLKTYLKSSMMVAFGQINVEEDKLYIGISGIMLCLNAKDGSLVWMNELKGWGYQFVSIANVNTDAASNMDIAQQQAASAAATAAIIATTTI